MRPTKKREKRSEVSGVFPAAWTICRAPLIVGKPTFICNKDFLENNPAFHVQIDVLSLSNRAGNWYSFNLQSNESFMHAFITTQINYVRSKMIFLGKMLENFQFFWKKLKKVMPEIQAAAFLFFPYYYISFNRFSIMSSSQGFLVNLALVSLAPWLTLISFHEAFNKDVSHFEQQKLNWDSLKHLWEFLEKICSTTFEETGKPRQTFRRCSQPQQSKRTRVKMHAKGFWSFTDWTQKWESDIVDTQISGATFVYVTDLIYISLLCKHWILRK